jgi:hypothetical protein
VKSNGASFILPLTNALPGWEERTDSLREAIDEAHQGWVMVESDTDQDSRVTMPKDSKKLQSLELKWFNSKSSRLIKTAFRGRIILTQQEALTRFRKTSRRKITENE